MPVLIVFTPMVQERTARETCQGLPFAMLSDKRQAHSSGPMGLTTPMLEVLARTGTLLVGVPIA